MVTAAVHDKEKNKEAEKGRQGRGRGRKEQKKRKRKNFISVIVVASMMGVLEKQQLHLYHNLATWFSS